MASKELPENDPFQEYSKTCSLMFSKLSKSQLEYLQSAIKLQDEFFNSCDGLVKNQIDMFSRLVEAGLTDKEKAKDLVSTANKFTRVYIDWVTLAYGLATSRMEFYHKIQSLANEYALKQEAAFADWLNQLKSSTKAKSQP